MNKDGIDLLCDFLIEGLNEKTPFLAISDNQKLGSLIHVFQTYIRNRTEEYRKSHTFPCGRCAEPHKVTMDDGTELSVTCLNDKLTPHPRSLEGEFMRAMENMGVRFVDMVATDDDEEVK